MYSQMKAASLMPIINPIKKSCNRPKLELHKVLEMEFENDVSKTNSDEGSVCRSSLSNKQKPQLRTMINMMLLFQITILQGGLTNTPCIYHQNFGLKTLASENLIVNLYKAPKLIS